LNIPILLERDDLLVIDKPAGLTVIPARGEEASECLTHRLQAVRGERLWVVHRLDRETSGVMVLARSAAAHKLLCEAFEARRVEKQYLAFCQGQPAAQRGVITAPLLKLSGGGGRLGTEAEGAQRATTGYRVIAQWPLDGGMICKVEATPLTGRQHQIRLHLRSVGLPLLGDRRYGPTLPLLQAPRLALHAASLRLPALGGHAAVTVTCALAEDLAALESGLVSTAG
jgi:RluA family pseudouridine synthase